MFSAHTAVVVVFKVVVVIIISFVVVICVFVGVVVIVSDAVIVVLYIWNELFTIGRHEEFENDENCVPFPHKNNTFIPSMLESSASLRARCECWPTSIVAGNWYNPLVVLQHAKLIESSTGFITDETIVDSSFLTKSNVCLSFGHYSFPKNTRWLKLSA